MAETGKAHERRVQSGWYQKYIVMPGIDIGCGLDPLCPPNGDRLFRYDNFWTNEGSSRGDHMAEFDATLMAGIPDESYQTVYASHVLEHLKDPVIGLQNWWRILRPGGYLIVCVPHRDLYEKKQTKPSLWNPHDRPGGHGHETFWLPHVSEEPDTLSFYDILSTALPSAEFVEFNVLDHGYDYSLPADVHPVGEYAIEAILRKPERT
jgi:SAM-dependent methyltransferase